jgi:predicted HTH domain antitoxin
MTTQKTLINSEALLNALAQQTKPLPEPLQHSLQEAGQALQNDRPDAAYQLRELIKQEPLLEIAYQNALEQWDEQYASQQRAKSLSAAFQNPSILDSLFLKDVAPSQDWVTAARKITHQQKVQPTSARVWVKGASISGAIAQILSALVSATVTAVHRWSIGFSKQATVTISDLPNILTLEETAAYLRLSPTTVAQRALQGDIPGQQIDNTWHFLKPEIDHWRQTHDKRAILLKQAGALVDDDTLENLGPLSLEISPDSLSQGEPAIRQAIALQLYAQNIFTLGQARRLADLSVWEFQKLLAQHKIQRHYNEADLEQDIQEIQTGSW